MPEESFGWTLIQRVNWIRGSDLSSKEKLVLYTLAGHDGPSGIYPSLATIENESCVPHSTLLGVLRGLSDKGLLVRKARTVADTKCHSSTQYELNIPVGGRSIADLRRSIDNQGLVNSRPTGWSAGDQGLVNSRPQTVSINRPHEQTTGTPGAPPQTPSAPPSPNGLTPPEGRASQTTLAGIIPPSQPAPPPKPRKTPQKPAKGSNGADRTTRMPDGFEPTDQHRELAKSLGINLGVEFPKFVDYCAAHGSRYIDWNAAFRNWIRNSSQFSRGPTRPVPRESNLPDVDDMIAARRKNANPAK